jgi:putative SOS response-associated peptidase YedK
MCGRYTLAHAEAAKAAVERLGLKIAEDVALPTRFNVAPTQVMPVVTGGAEPALVALHWGHFAQFSPDAKPTLIINGRSEEAAGKRTFKKAVEERRCIVPADGFYEWLRSQGGKVRVPYYFRRKDGQTFWIQPTRDSRSVRSCWSPSREALRQQKQI